MTLQTLDIPITMFPVVSASQCGGYQTHSQFQWQEHKRNGIVYVGEEIGRTRQIYRPSGLPARESSPLGQLIDIYV